jgi:hypothetical protein
VSSVCDVSVPRTVADLHHGLLEVDGAPDDLSARRQSADADGAGSDVQFDAV